MAFSDMQDHKNIYFLSIKIPFLRKLLKDILQQNEGIKQKYEGQETEQQGVFQDDRDAARSWPRLQQDHGGSGEIMDG